MATSHHQPDEIEAETGMLNGSSCGKPRGPEKQTPRDFQKNVSKKIEDDLSVPTAEKKA